MKLSIQSLWLFIALIAIIGLIVTGCKEPEDNSTKTPTHTHSWGEWSLTTAATCVAQGSQTRACTSCAETQTEVIAIDPAAHDMQAVEGAVELEPTCTEDGFGKMACANEGCAHIENGAVILMLGHLLQLVENGTVIEAATCLETGIGEVECLRDGCTYTDDEGIIPIDPNAHEFGDWTNITREPTCTTPGAGIRECNICERPVNNMAVPVNPDNHDWGGWLIITDATCQDEGERERHCRYEACLFSDPDTVIPIDDVFGHDYQYDSNSIPPNCVDRGSGTGTCSLCDETIDWDESDIDIDPNNHKSLDTEFHVTLPATCIEIGESYLRCSACNEYDTHVSSFQAVPINPANHDPACTPTYIITGSGTAFTANFTYSECDSVTLVGTANQTIANAVNAIRTHAAGADVTIQFGNGSNVLDIGTASAAFNNTGGTWGLITLTGRITSANSTGTQGTIALAGGVSINSTADIANTPSTNGRAIYNDSTGTLNILDGTVSSSGRGIVSMTAGTVNISGGTVSATFDISVVNDSTGTINISGGTISATTGQAVLNASSGMINISGADTVITSANISSTSGTVVNGWNGAATMIISGGTIRNTAASANARAVRNVNSNNTLTITGGTIGAMTADGTPTAGVAVWNNAAGAVTISGADTVIISANVTAAAGTVNNFAGGSVTIEGGTITNTADNANALAVNSDHANASLVLDGSPVITGGIRALAGRLSTASGFNPGKNTYLLNFAGYANGSILVAGGAAFISNFTVAAANIVPTVSGANIVAAAGYHYIRTETGGVHTITRIETAAGAIGIQAIIDEIRTAAAGNAVTVQFGNGTEVLNIGTASAGFSGNWGLITLTGRITGANTDPAQGTVNLEDAVSITSTADITNTAAGTDGRAIRNGGTGTVNISGGTVSATTGQAVSNASTGAVTISGGTVSATTGQAVNNASTGKIIVSGTALVTSENVTSTAGTIVLASSGTATAARLEINGGTVRNTSNSSANARAVYNASTGAVVITGGTVGAMTAAGAGTIGVAVWNNSTGALTISGADTVITSANTTLTSGTVNNNAGGSITITGGSITNTANNANANAIRNAAAGTITLSNCTVQANAHADAHAIRNVSTVTTRIIFEANVIILGRLLNCPALP